MSAKKISAGGAAVTPSAVNSMGSWGCLGMGSAAFSPSAFIYHKARYDG
jgi:hypothetical protein